MAVRSTESHSMASVPDGELEEENSVSGLISAAGQDAAFASGQRKGPSYGRVLRGAPDHVDWGRRMKEPSEDLVLFLRWVDSKFTRMEDGQFRSSGADSFQWQSFAFIELFFRLGQGTSRSPVASSVRSRI
eukprot:1476522-Pyramimonas_sp.AAC.1